MKKNKLAFLIAASFLALSSIAGCNLNTPSNGNSNEAGNSVQPSSDAGGDSNGQNSQGGGDTSQGGGNTSQGGGNTSEGGGTETKTDWSDTEKATMKEQLHGLVLPFVEMDVSVTVSQNSGTLRIESQDNMAQGFLASYKAKFDADPAWVGEDISSEYGVYAGNAFAYQRKVAENGKNYYVAVMFTGVIYPQGGGEPTITKDGRFYLEAMDPYVYEYPATFIAQWLKVSFNSEINPPAFQAEFYSLDSEGVLFGYSETNIENSYKTAVESSGNFTIDSEKNAQGYYVAHPKDGTYVMYFKYDVENKIMILMVDAPKGWNNAAINKIFNDNNVIPFSLGTIENPDIRFSATEQSYAETTYMFISVDGVTVQEVQTYINGLKALGYKVADSNVVVESNQYFTTVNVVTNEGMFTIYVTYSTAENANNLMIYFSLAPNPNVVKTWPAASITRYIEAEHDTVPAFVGSCYGYSFSWNQGAYANIVVIVDEGSESTAKDSYIATLTTDNGYVASGTLGGQPAFKSPNNEILVAIGCDPTACPGEINILIKEIEVVVTPWPSANIASAIGELSAMNPITDTVPALDVSEANSCYVNNNYGGEKFEICIDGLAASESDFIGAFKAAGWTEDPYYEFDSMSSAYGALISPNKQLVAYFDTVSNDLVITVKSYFEPFSYTWPSQEINQVLNKWGVKFDTLPSFDRVFAEVQEDSSNQELNIYISVGDALKERVVTDYCLALESAAYGYQFNQDLGGHISNNHELLIKFDTTYTNGVIIIVSCVKVSYRVVGYNNNDWSFANGLQMTVTPEEGNYKIQYQASFHVDANAKFKVLDSENNWYGGLNNFAKYSNANNDIFSIQENGDIKVNAAGTVTVYFKIYDDNSKDMWLEFAADPVAASWPTITINGYLEDWNVNEVIPELTDASIADIQCELADGGKQFTITLVGGAGLVDQYEETLAASFELEGEYYVPTSGDIKIHTHASGNDLIITVQLVEQELPDLKPWPGAAIAEFFEDEAFDFIPEIMLAGASFEAEEPVIDSAGKYFTIHVIVANAEDAAMNAAIAFLSSSEYSYDNDLGYYKSTLGNYPLFSFEPDDENGFYIEIIALAEPEEEPAYRVVGTFNSWLYDNGETLNKVLEPEEGYSAQYTVSFYVNLGDEFKVTNNTDDPWLGFDDLETNANFGTNGDGNIIAKHSGYVDLTLNILTNGEKEVIINFDADDEQPTEVTYTFIPDDDWASLTADNAVFYAYVWGDGYTGPQWIKLSIDWDNNCFYLEDFPLGSGAEHFIIVRMNPDCEEDGNEPGWGYKWNQTDDWDFPEAGITFHVNVLKN